MEVENRMVIDSEWEYSQSEREKIREKLSEPGYKQIGTDVFVPESEAFSYALEQCVYYVPADFKNVQWLQDFKDMLIEWFYNEDWVKEE